MHAVFVKQIHTNDTDKIIKSERLLKSGKNKNNECIITVLMFLKFNNLIVKILNLTIKLNNVIKL